MHDEIKKTLDQVKKAWTQPGSAATGLQVYDLDAPSKKLFPVLSPLRNTLPRVGGGRSVSAHWRAVTALNTATITPGVSEGNRNAVVTTTTSDYSATFKGLGLEDTVTFESQYAGMGFEDIRALSRKNLLSALMIEEERVILGGNGTNGIALGIPATPTGALVAGGSMTAQANVCYVVALTLEAYRQSSVAGGVVTTLARTNADGSSDTVNLGSSDHSAESAGVTTAGGNLSVTWSVTAIRGAVAYAWYTGLTGQANCTLAAITTANKFEQTADAAGTQAATAITADRSKDALVFDGILTQVSKSGSNGYWLSKDNATLTADGKGGIDEFNTLLQDRWENYKLVPDDIWVSAQQAKDISDKIMSGGLYSINVSSGEGSLRAGGRVTSYLCPITGKVLQIHVHPYMPNGTILFTSRGIPYPLNGVPAVWQIKFRRNYHSMEWPLKTRKYEMGVYLDEVLQGFFPPANGVICNIKAG